jgi:hypothetical protein
MGPGSRGAGSRPADGGEQVTKVIALMGLVAIQVALSLANYWFTFGLWPRSWASFVFYGLASVVVVGLIRIVQEDK